MISGESFITKPNKTTYMIRDIIKKNTKKILNYLLLVVHLMQDLLEKFLLV